MSYSGGTASHESQMLDDSMHDVLTNPLLSYFPLHGNENESAIPDHPVHELLQDGDLDLLDVASPMNQDSSAAACLADGLGSNHVNPFQQSGSSSTAMSGLYETKIDFSQTAERLILQMELFTSTIHQYGKSTNKLESELNACNSFLGLIEEHLNAITHRMENMENRLRDMGEKLVSLDGNLKTLDGYLLEIIKREKDMMKDFSEIPRK